MSQSLEPLNVGDVLQDNDPRIGYDRRLVVVEILPNGVIAKDTGGRPYRYLRYRIYTDNKPRRNGLRRIWNAGEQT